VMTKQQKTALNMAKFIQGQTLLLLEKQVIEAQCAIQGIRDAVERISGMSQQMAAASEEQASVAEDIARQINNVAGTVERTAKNANSAVIRGRELESTSHGFNSLVERFNR
jgi:aerotaxis receptor